MEDTCIAGNRRVVHKQEWWRLFRITARVEKGTRPGLVWGVRAKADSYGDPERGQPLAVKGSRTCAVSCRFYRNSSLIGYQRVGCILIVSSSDIMPGKPTSPVRQPPVLLLSHGTTMLAGERSQIRDYWTLQGNKALEYGIKGVIIMVCFSQICRPLRNSTNDTLYL